ncbi:transmembrane protein 238-like [Mauremys mutica]|uniref:transmembrane protein 238-like n=1 Tax=Mauremys mutica TaxID=74926 RepID=UPI001D169169|nr:transmembrane protein 238-like [Mauremys mutica]
MASGSRAGSQRTWPPPPCPAPARIPAPPPAPRIPAGSVPPAPRIPAGSVPPPPRTPRDLPPAMAAGGLGRCRLALGLALLLDGAGMGALLTGIFARLRVRGQDFGDLLIYSGAVLVFLSLLGWVLWYTGNLELAPDELGRDYGAKGGTLARLARKISRRWSRRQPGPLALGPVRGSQGPPPRETV